MMHYDVAVVGGGPAGSCAAAFARQAGLSVVLLEKERFPRFRIGESLLPQGNEVLRATGVWPKVEQAGFLRKEGAFFCSGDGAIEKEVLFADGLIPGLESTFQVERARFDALLLDHARELGAEVELPATVTAIQEEADHVSVSYRDHAGVRHLRARWLLDASGRDRRFSAPLKEQLDPPQLDRRVAIYNHFRDVPRPAGPQGNHTIIVRLQSGWFWLIPIDAERTSVGLVTTVEAMRASRVSPADLFRREVEASRKLRTLLRDATPLMDHQVTADYSYFHRELARDRVILLGDAAGFFDPIFSSGVYLATYSAQLSVALVAQAQAAGGRGLTHFETRRYTRRLKRHANVFRHLITAFYDDASASVFLQSKSPLQIARGINAIVAGHAQLAWPVRWRFWAFLATCWLQRYVELVPPVDLGRREPPLSSGDGEALEEIAETA